MSKKTLSESLARLEEILIDAEKNSNKRLANATKMIIKRLKKKAPVKELFKKST